MRFNFENSSDREKFMQLKQSDPEKAQNIVDEEHQNAENYAMLHQYDKISLEYALATITDPNKRFVQYPEALRLIGSLDNKSVLDIGCANGTFTRMLAANGAKRIVAYEPSANELEKAKGVEKEFPQGIEYVSGYNEIAAEKFDVVTAIMVIPAVNHQQMNEIFSHASNFLKEGGKFVALTLNPDFRRYGEIINNRKFSKRTDRKIDIDFFNADGEKYMSIIDTYFSKDEIEQACEKVELKDVSWKKLQISSAGIKELGDVYWKGYVEDCPYIGLVAYK